MVTLWFIRHGQASFGNEDYDRLSPVGIRQSRILGTYLKKTGTFFDSIYTGQMNRQKDTAALVSNSSELPVDTLPHVTMPAFNEYDYMSIIQTLMPGIKKELGLTDETVKAWWSDNRKFQFLYKNIMERWVSGSCDMNGTETYKAYFSRVKEGIIRVLEKSTPNQTIGIFTSGGVISIIMQMALNLSDKMSLSLSWQIKNCSVTQIGGSRQKDNGKCLKPGFHYHLVSFNSTAHLDLENETELITYR